MKAILKREEGQSIIIVALALVALVGLMALVVDAGNAYVQKRKFQNAADASAEAGGLALGLNKNEGQIVTAMRTFIESNGLLWSSVTPYYVVQDNSGNRIVTTYSIPYYNNSHSPPTQLQWPTGGGPSLPVVGVNIQGSNSFPTFFAGVVGIRNMNVGGGANALVNSGPCSANNLFPVGISFSTFPLNNGVPTMDFDPTHFIPLHEDAGTYQANRFGYMTWNGTVGLGTFQANMTNPLTNQSGSFAVNDNVPNAQDSSIHISDYSSTLSSYKTSGAAVTAIIYDNDVSSRFHVKGFGRMVIVNYDTSSSNHEIDVRFIRWDSPNGQGGCLNFGTNVVGPPPPPQPTTPPGTQPAPNPRVLIGQVKINRLTGTHTVPVTTHVPVDVVNVLDISGSMDQSFGGSTKLTAAQSALTSFNNNMQPSLGDQVGLVTFPKIQSGSSYNYTCTQSGSFSNYYFGQVRNNLTTSISTVNSTINGLSANGGTPLADGVRQGRLTVLGANHVASHPAVMIIASDGIANIRLNGQWTGDSGNSYDNNACNQPSVQDAIDQANISKSDANADGLPDVTIYTIAVGNNFNPASLQAVATFDTDPAKPHYFQATDSGTMASIYQQIATQVQTIGQSSCSVVPTYDLASGATVVVKNLNTGVSTTLTTNGTGDFFLEQPAAGTYQFQSATITVNGLTYNVFTDGVGGPVLGTNPTVDIPIGSGTYKFDLALKTTQSPCQ